MRLALTSLYYITCCLFLSKNLRAQDTGKYKLVFEKVFVHTDRDLYLPGDTIWYKAYVVDAQSHKPSDISKNLHIEVISPNAVIVQSAVIRTDQGFGNGDFILPDSLPAGTYRLRAYTNWMRNFGQHFFFEKLITVFSSPYLFKDNKAISRNLKAATGVRVPVAQSAIVSMPAVRFFPEGGAMVNGISSVVAIKAESEAGKGMPVNGTIVSSAGDSVATFTTDSLGFGILVMLPLNGQRYTTKVNGQLYQLPPALNTGPAMRIRQTDSSLKVMVTLTGAVGMPSYWLTVKHAGITFASTQVLLKDAQTTLSLSKKDLPEGINAITLYDNDHKPYCERLVYVHHATDTAATATGITKTTQPTGLTTIQIKSRPNANLSVAVTDAGLANSNLDIVSYLMLGSEIKGEVEHASRYFDVCNHSRWQQLDLLLMTQGWRDYLWRRMADTAIRISYAPEKGFSIKGQVLQAVRNQPLSNTSVSMFANKKVGNKLQAVLTDSAGSFAFNDIIQNGVDTLVLTARDLKGRDAGRIKLDTLRYSVPATAQRQNALIPDTLSEAARQRLSANIERQKRGKVAIQLKEVKVKASPYIQLRDMQLTSFGYADEVLVPKADDKPDETIRAFILMNSKQARLENEAEVNAGKMSPGGANPDAVIENRLVFYADGQNTYPRLIVDGYELPTTMFGGSDEVVKNALYNSYLDMPLSKAEKVVIKRGLAPPKIIKASSVLNNFSNLGGTVSDANITSSISSVFVIFLTLKPGAMEERNNIARIPLQGYQQAREFYKPLNQKEAAQLSYRTTVHWEPYVRTDAEGRATVLYKHGYLPRELKLIAQGISQNGESLTGIAQWSEK